MSLHSMQRHSLVTGSYNNKRLTFHQHMNMIYSCTADKENHNILHCTFAEGCYFDFFPSIFISPFIKTHMSTHLLCKEMKNSFF